MSIFETQPLLSGRRVLVTGGTGFIGSHVVRRLLRDGAHVYVMTPSVSSIRASRLADIWTSINVVEANVTDRSAMDHVVSKVQPELVAHLAAYTHVAKSFQRVNECVSTNLQGTMNLLLALRGEFRRFVYTGTSEIYGDVPAPFIETAIVNPVSPYSVTKYSGELASLMFNQAYGWPIVCLRPFNAYGPWQSSDRVIPEIILTAQRRGELLMSAGTQTREFNYVEDTADAFARALVAPEVDGMVLNVGCGDDISIRDLATKVLQLMGNPITPRFGALPPRPTEIWRMYSDSSRARDLLGWRPTRTLEDGLRGTIDWYRQFGDLI